MVNLTQTPFPGENVRFVENRDPRCPCILLLDTSASMGGEPIQQLNQGIQDFKNDVMKDSIATRRIELAVVTFGPVKIQGPFQPVNEYNPPIFEANGNTPIGEAIATAIDLTRERKDFYRTKSVQYYRPWIILITDGAPTDSWQAAAKLVQEGETEKKFAFFGIGVDRVDMKTLGQICPHQRPPLKLKGLQFSEFFLWLSSSLGSVSHSQVDEKISLKPTTGWSEIS
jgi:uncharacterized protein YegL